MYKALNKAIMDFLPGVPISHSPPAIVFGKDVTGRQGRARSPTSGSPPPSSSPDLTHRTAGGRCHRQRPPATPPHPLSEAAVFRFIVRRLLQLIPTLFGLSLLLFIWLRRCPAVPRPPSSVSAARPRCAPRSAATSGLDEPILVQYGRFVRRLIRLDLGTSTCTKRPVITEFVERFPGTVELTVTAMVIAIGVGIPLGYLAARRRGRIAGPPRRWAAR